MRRLTGGSLFGLALAAAGAALLAQWGRIWSLAPDLAWGWVVPLLMAYFLWARWTDRPPWRQPDRGIAARILRGAAGVGALTILPVSRFLLEPFPGWPLVEWVYSGGLIGLILLLIGAREGTPRARHFAWPLLFGLSALPWPALITVGVLGPLRIGFSGLVAEVLNFFGEPATSTGTVIEVARGFVGIDEACGGIRSLQAVAMVALAIGELRRDRWVRRLAWLGLGAALALAANVLRIAALTLICAEAGPKALAAWHDRVAAAEMIVTLGALALLAVRAGTPAPRARAAATRPAENPRPASSALAAIVLGTLAATEIATLAWFGAGDARARKAARWSAHLPADLPSYSEDEFSPVMQDLLACDSHELGHWRDPSGARCAGYVIEWHRGHFAPYAVRLHNPDICLNMAGSELVRTEPSVTATVGPFVLPFSAREFRRGGDTYHVYFLAWNISSGEPLSIAATARDTPLSWFARQWTEVRSQQRRLEARVVALAIFDAATTAEADRLFRSEAARMLEFERHAPNLVPGAGIEPATKGL